MRAVALLLTLASCVETSPAYPLTVPVTAGQVAIGAFHFAAADDDVHGTCAPVGARDVSFEVSSAMTQTVVFDTDPDQTKTTTDVAISIADGRCPAQQVLACAKNPCPGFTYDTLATTLIGGQTYCLVVEQADPASSTDLVTLRMFTSGRRAAQVFSGAGGAMMGGTTCAGDDPLAPPFGCAGSGGGPSSVALVSVCPGPHHLMGNVQPDQPVAFSLRPGAPSAQEISCFIAASPSPINVPETLNGPLPYWVVIERATPMCGSYQLTLGAP